MISRIENFKKTCSTRRSSERTNHPLLYALVCGTRNNNMLSISNATNWGMEQFRHNRLMELPDTLLFAGNSNY